MSWIDDIKNDLIITCGDGVSFFPNWINAKKELVYNVAEFEFFEQDGTLVKRSKPKGLRYSLEIYFQGDDHLAFSRSFEESSKDSRPWIMEHPFYGRVLVQPISLEFDNSKLNLTKISGTVVQTIEETNPKINFNPKDKITADKIDVDDKFSIAGLSEPIPVAKMKTNNEGFYSDGNKLIKDPTIAEEYFNAFSDANSAVLNATSKPLAAIRAMQALINLPALFKISVKERMTLLITQHNRLVASVVGNIDNSTKLLYEVTGGAIISGMALATANPLTEKIADKPADYSNRVEVLSISQLLLNTYNSYIVLLNSFQSINNGGLTSYMPQPAPLIALDDLISFTISNLFNIANNAKQERSLILENDSNCILLAHRLYGLKQDDSTLDDFILNNNIGINEMLIIKKGRKILYYI